MSHAPPLKLLLKRGALIAAANGWVVVLQFLAEASFKLLLAVPAVAAAFLVALLIGGSAAELASVDVHAILAVLLGAFADHPLLVLAYGFGLAVTVAGGTLLTVLVKGGTVTTLIEAERRAGNVEAPPLNLSRVGRAAAFRLDRFMAGCGRLFFRYARLAALLAGAYVGAAIVYAAAVLGSYQVVSFTGIAAAWPIVAAVISGTFVLVITAINLLYLLLQLAMAADDCGLRAGVGHVRAFLRAEGATVALVFVTLLLIVGLATVASILGTAGLGFIGFIPIVGLTVLPLQVLAWVARGLLFQYIGLSALVAYAHLYERHRRRGGRVSQVEAVV